MHGPSSSHIPFRVADSVSGQLLPLLMVGLALVAVAGRGAIPTVGPVPDELREAWDLDPFYRKHVRVGGFPILGSDRVRDPALLEAAYLVGRMLDGRDDIRDALVKSRVRFVVMAADEFTTQVPEHSTLEPARFWDKRARGLGATRRRPVVSCGEENLLGYAGDPYFEENILIHEFAHAIHGVGLAEVAPGFDGRLREAYDAALAAGLWKGTYAAVNHGEYWAEAVQSWFDCNRENDAQHNHVSTRERLKDYDPGVAALVAEVFGDRPWRYSRPAARPAGGEGTAHLAGYDPATAPRFAWPQDLIDWNQAYALQVNRPEASLLELPLLGPDPDPISRPVATLRDSSILFLNRRDGPVRLLKLHPDGTRTPEAGVEAGGSRRVATFAGQTWLVLGEGGEALGTVVSSFEPGKVLLK